MKTASFWEASRRDFGVTTKGATGERFSTLLGRFAFRELMSESQYQAGLAFDQL